MEVRACFESVSAPRTPEGSEFDGWRLEAGAALDTSFGLLAC